MSAFSPRQMFLLDMACKPIQDGIGDTYLVGTAMEPRDGKPPRDIDVRTILDDNTHDRLVKALGLSGVAFLGVAVGQYLHSLTGLPIDYQIQRQTEANAVHKGTRNPLGTRSLSNFEGDATPGQANIARAKSLEDIVPGMRAQTLADIRDMGTETKRIEGLRVQWIKRARELGVPAQEVAEAAGISRQQVYRITSQKDGSK